MKIKKKLRDVTPEEYEKYTQKICTEGDSDDCKKCMFKNVHCRIPSLSSTSWVLHKDIYSDKFLNQKIEIECDILTKEEREYLSNVIKLYKDRVKYIEKINFITTGYFFIRIVMEVKGFIPDVEYDAITLALLEGSKIFKGMEQGKRYTLEELGLQNATKYF